MVPVGDIEAPVLLNVAHNNLAHALALPPLPCVRPPAYVRLRPAMGNLGPGLHPVAPCPVDSDADPAAGPLDPALDPAASCPVNPHPPDPGPGPGPDPGTSTDTNSSTGSDPQRTGTGIGRGTSTGVWRSGSRGHVDLLVWSARPRLPLRSGCLDKIVTGEAGWGVGGWAEAGAGTGAGAEAGPGGWDGWGVGRARRRGVRARGRVDAVGSGWPCLHTVCLPAALYAVLSVMHVHFFTPSPPCPPSPSPPARPLQTCPGERGS